MKRVGTPNRQRLSLKTKRPKTERNCQQSLEPGMVIAISTVE